MNHRTGLAFLLFFSFFSLDSLSAPSCTGYEALKFWPEPISTFSSIRVEVCCSKNYNTKANASTYSKDGALLIQLKLSDNAEVEVFNLEIDNKKPVTYSCKKNSSFYGKCTNFRGANIKPELRNGLALRVFHEQPEMLMTAGGDTPYYGFRVIKGTVDIRDADKAEKLCGAKSSNGSESASKITIP